MFIHDPAFSGFPDTAIEDVQPVGVTRLFYGSFDGGDCAEIGLVA